MALNWENLVVGHQNRSALNHPFSGRLEDGGIYAIIGPNGCGKSTLLKTWLGLLSPWSGEVKINGASPAAGTLPLAYVPQSQQVNKYFQISVQDFVMQGFGRHPPAPADALPRVRTALVQWELSADAQKSFHLLSGGQKTRAMVARAILSNPKMIFLDEPLANLDACCQQQLMDTLHVLAHQNNICVVMVDHHFEAYEKLLSAKFLFERSHNAEICTVRFEPKDDTCCKKN
ncbi:MAG: ATP-binding cassette domain-containing protein [Betaproteobacteria bacterium]|nr:ATP-binding cassette domain-containing protein [Betaproteobacteria bacterium]